MTDLERSGIRTKAALRLDGSVRAASASGLGRWRICSRTGSTSARSCTAARFTRENMSRSSTATCSRPYRPGLPPTELHAPSSSGEPPAFLPGAFMIIAATA